MPIFDYVCTKCGCEFEDIVDYSKRKERRLCPGCGKKMGKYLEKAHNFNYSLNRSFSRMRHGK